MSTHLHSVDSKLLPRTSRRFRSLLRDQRGSIGIIAAVSLAVLLAFGGLGVDAALWMRSKYNAQGAADAAANSVAAAAAIGNPASRITAEANAAANGFQNGMNGVTVTMNNPPASGAYAGNASAFEVIVSSPQQLYLASALAGITAPIVKSRAVALLVAGTPAPTFPTCVLGLSPQPSKLM